MKKQSLLERFSCNLERLLGNLEQPLLVAVSGGVDSVTLLDLLARCRVKLAVAHCNFGLRGDESEQDHAFVRQLASNYGAAFHDIRFETSKFAQQHGISIQMAARQLRYQFFDELCSEHHYPLVAIAHNRDDKAETLFINLSRGSGIRGLASIKDRTGKIIRPLLFASREEILEYVEQQQLQFREDSSNLSDKYARNIFRHKLFDVLQEAFPAARANIERSLDNLSEAEKIYIAYTNQVIQECSKVEGNSTKIDLQVLKNCASPSAVLFEILNNFQFHADIAQQLLKHETQVGAIFQSPSYIAQLDRNFIIIRDKLSQDSFKLFQSSFKLERMPSKIFTLSEDFGITIEEVEYSPEILRNKQKNVIYLDADKVQFPIYLAQWQSGDVMQPFGMRGRRKKLSDILSELKIPRVNKEFVPVIHDQEKIIWLVPFKQDERTRIDINTKRVLKIQASALIVQ